MASEVENVHLFHYILQSTLQSDQVSGSSRNLQAIATIDRDHLHGNNILKTKRQGN